VGRATQLGSPERIWRQAIVVTHTPRFTPSSARSDLPRMTHVAGRSEKVRNLRQSNCQMRMRKHSLPT
jgi:hypothetical protein